MGCKACERRRKALAEKRRKKQDQGKPVQAAAIGAALAVTDAVGKALGIETEQAISDSYAGRVEALESVDALFDVGAALAVTEVVGRAIGIEAGDGEASPDRGAEEPTGSP